VAAWRRVNGSVKIIYESNSLNIYELKLITLRRHATPRRRGRRRFTRGHVTPTFRRTQTLRRLDGAIGFAAVVVAPLDVRFAGLRGSTESEII
jgi:hypothetical protein